MIRRLTIPRVFAALATLTAMSLLVAAQQPNQPGRTRYDITEYRIEAQLIPSQHQLRAGADITFTPLDATRTIIFELNGSLKVDAIERNGKPVPNFVQDSSGADVIGPNVRVDLGEVVLAGTPITLRFRWGGPLVTADGGPLATKRLAYVGDEGSYLMYASRWFPFHEYAADRATSDVTIIVPNGTQVVGVSDEPVVPSAPGGDGNTRFHFVQRKPVLVGNYAAGKYITKTLRMGENEIQFSSRLGSENRVDQYAEIIGHALKFYAAKYGAPDCGTKLVVAQIDDDSLDAYAAPGMMFLASRLFDPTRAVPEQRLQREVAYQWWGQTVGLRAFDDAWISQGLAEWSAYALRETQLKDADLEAAMRELQERALTFEQVASIARAPATLDDQSAAFQSIVFFKGAAVFHMLRQTIGAQKFDQLLRTFLDQFRGRNASIDDFEKLTTKLVGENMRYFFARWVEGTGVPEFTAEYQIIRTRRGKFVTRGTVAQNYENLKMPVEVMLRTDHGSQSQSLLIEEKSEDFTFESDSAPTEVIVDPRNRILRNSDDLRVSAIARRGIEQFKEGNFAEAQLQFEAALKLDRNNAWVFYNLGLLYLEQRNYEQAKDNFKAAMSIDNPNPAWISVWSHIKRGNAYDAQGDRSRAVTEYQHAKEALDKFGEDYDNAKAAIKQFLATPYDPRGTQTT